MYTKIKTAVAVAALGGALMMQAGAVAADPAEKMIANPCAGCHGINGASMGDAPVIAGLSQPYLVSTMKAYRDGTRYSTIMGRIAKGYSDAQIDTMSNYFSAQTWPKNTQTIDADLAAKGSKLHASKGCIGCHGPVGTPFMATVPRLSGQYFGFLKQQMVDYQDADKAIPATAMTMRGMTAGLSEDDLAALAAFYASQK